MVFRAGLHNGEQVYRSRMLWEWSNTIGYEMGSSLVRVYTIANAFPVENFKHGWENDMAINMAIFLA